MVSKCCWRPDKPENKPETIDNNSNSDIVVVSQNNGNNTVTSNGSTNNLLSYEDDVEHKLEITDLTTQNKRKLVKFHDESQIHEIPAKPKRTPKAEKRNKLLLNSTEPQQQQIIDCTDDSRIESKESNIESVELCQRASITSLQDLKPLVLNSKEKQDLTKV